VICKHYSHANQLRCRISIAFEHTRYHSTLSSPITVGHTNFLEPPLTLIVRINAGHISFQSL
jgi:hypothetical protein